MIGAFLDVQLNGNYKKADQSFENFERAKQGIVNPNIELMENILNHLRVFSIESFRYLPQF